MEHAGDYRAEAAVVATQPLIWSYDAFQHVQWGFPCHNDGTRDRSRMASAALPHYSLEYGWGVVQIQSLRAEDVARWLFGPAALVSQGFSGRPERVERVDSLLQAFADYDYRRVDARQTMQARSHVGRMSGIQRRRLIAKRSRDAIEQLRAFGIEGLERRRGSLLGSTERVWIHVAARGLDAPGLRVCEQCALVFQAPRARRCPECRRRPLRIPVRPLVRGGHHHDVRVGPRWGSGDFDRTVTYFGRCVECTAGFASNDVRTRLCANCASPAGRLRRHRSSQERLGQATYRYAHAEGEPLISTGVIGPHGEQLLLEAVDGIVETRDLEIVKLLDANPSLARIPRD
jgi:hypothetical protein